LALSAPLSGGRARQVHRRPALGLHAASGTDAAARQDLHAAGTFRGRALPVVRRPLLAVRRLLCILLLACGVFGPVHSASESVVLVVRADSPVKDLGSVEVRKLFL